MFFSILKNTKERIFWISLIIIIIFSGYCSGTATSLRVEDPEERSKYLSLFNEAYSVLRTSYVDKEKITHKALLFGAINGMFKNLEDPYSRFLDDKTFALLQDQMKGSFGGFGFSFMERDGEIIILYTLPNSPARKSDIKPRDRIIEVNGKPIKGLSNLQLINKLRGKPNTEVSFTVLRGKKNKRIVKTITRAIINSIDVEHRLINKSIGYIKLKKFSNISASKVRKALLELKQQNIKSLIFDLRENPGGNLLASLYIINFFIKGDLKLVYIKNQGNKPGKSLYSDGRITIFSKLPLVVLSNENSASASEIFIGAIQDYHRGVVIGSKTFGKGSVQVYEPTKGPIKAGFKVTASKWYTPKGRVIDKKGLFPDIEVKLPELTFAEKYFLVKLYKSKLLEKYVEENSSLTEKEIKSFHKSINAKGIKLNKTLVAHLLKSEKYKYIPDLTLDLSYDLVLKKGVDYLKEMDK